MHLKIFWKPIMISEGEGRGVEGLKGMAEQELEKRQGL